MIQLIVKDGALYVPGVMASGVQHEDSLLLRRYDAGDVDTVPWPLVSPYAGIDELEDRLASALYDERECNPAMPSNESTVILPDGKTFDFEEVLMRRPRNVQQEW